MKCKRTENYIELIFKRDGCCLMEFSYTGGSLASVFIYFCCMVVPFKTSHMYITMSANYKSNVVLIYSFP